MSLFFLFFFKYSCLYLRIWTFFRATVTFLLDSPRFVLKKKKGTKSSAGFRSSRCQHYFCRLLPPCCQVTPASAKQMCSSHCDRWPILIMLIHNKKKRKRETLLQKSSKLTLCFFWFFFMKANNFFKK